MGALVIVSMNAKGFPQADIYLGHADTDPCEFRCIAPSPDGFITLDRGDTLEAAFAAAQGEWPGAKVVYAEDGE